MGSGIDCFWNWADILSQLATLQDQPCPSKDKGTKLLMLNLHRFWALKQGSVHLHSSVLHTSYLNFGLGRLVHNTKHAKQPALWLLLLLCGSAVCGPHVF